MGHPYGTGKCDGGHFEKFREAWHLITAAHQNDSANSASSAI